MYIKTITYFNKGEKIANKVIEKGGSSFYPDELEKGYKLNSVDYFNDSYGNCVYMTFNGKNGAWVRVTIEKE